MATATKIKKTSKKKSKVKLQPLGEGVVIERDESLDTTAGGIVLPDSAQDKPARGKVLAIGNGKLLKDGKRGPMQVKVGDAVLFSSYSPQEVSVGEDEFLLLKESDILAVID